jgi:hypothetical protein
MFLPFRETDAGVFDDLCQRGQMRNALRRNDSMLG